MDLPKDFEKRMRHALGADWNRFYQSLLDNPPVSVRVNPKKKFQPTNLVSVPWCDTGYYLQERPIFTLDPHLHAGAYYVQEASSMFLEQAVNASVDLGKPLRVLDLCAAPGGKSTHLLSLLNAESSLISNEVIRSRASVLAENIQKWGHTNVIVTNNDPQDFQQLPNFFDIIVVDAPCSGEGLFRKEPAATKEWSEENANLCSLRQRRIVSDVWPSLKEGGVLIYSTCTYNPAENEGNLAWLAENQDIEFIELDKVSFGVERVIHGKVIGYRLMPGKVMGEGFFISAMRKHTAPSESGRQKFKSVSSRVTYKELTEWLPGDFHFTNHNGLIIGWPATLNEIVDATSHSLSVVSKGVAVATVKQNKLIPEHALALASSFNKESATRISLDLDQALKYLRKETLELPGYEKGFALVEYEDNPIGWINHLGTRVNNLYPLNWRIKMGPGGPTHASD